MRGHQFDHSHHVGRLFNDGLSLFADFLEKGDHTLAHEIDPPETRDTPILDKGALCEFSMGVEACDAHPALLLSNPGAGGTTRQLRIRARSAIG
jgi:hypothetical protein